MTPTIASLMKIAAALGRSVSFFVDEPDTPDVNLVRRDERAKVFTSKQGLELRNLSGRLLRLQDEERRRLAREIHDSTAQGLAALSLGLGVIAKSSQRLGTREQQALADAQVQVEQSAPAARLSDCD